MAWEVPYLSYVQVIILHYSREEGDDGITGISAGQPVGQALSFLYPGGRTKNFLPASSEYGQSGGCKNYRCLRKIFFYHE